LKTQERARAVSRFVILVPHRDVLKPLEEYRGRLFSIGFLGAYSFPSAAPLAAVSRCFSRDELKELAAKIRERTSKTDGKISSLSGADGKVAVYRDKPGLLIFGRSLDLSINDGIPENGIFEPFAAKVLYTFDPLVLCAALAFVEETPIGKTPVEETLVLEGAPEIVFRAGYVANLTIRPLPSGQPLYSFEWEIDTPVWLPKYRKV